MTIRPDFTNTKSIRDGWGEGLLEFGMEDERVVALTGDLADSTRVKEFGKKFPERFIECGVAEQNMMGIAAGMSFEGDIPYANSFAVFNPGRNWDQFRVSVCYSNANVKVAGHHSGFSNGGDGATHEGLEDLAITRVLPNLTILNPMDAVEAKQAVRVAGLIQGPVYVRLSKYDLPLITSESDSLTLGKARQFSSGNQVSVFVSGAMTSYALRAVLELSARYSIDMWSFTSIKPVDEDAIVRSASKTNLVLTIEDHQINAGFGSLVTEVLAGKRPTKVIRHGVYDTFGESGSIEDILHKYRLDSGGIKTEIIKVIEEGV